MTPGLERVAVPKGRASTQSCDSAEGETQLIVFDFSGGIPSTRVIAGPFECSSIMPGRWGTGIKTALAEPGGHERAGKLARFLVMERRQGARIGTAGWAIRREHDSHYDPGPSHLARYATRFNAVEINSSFYRPHRRATYERWAESVPADFRFAVKAPRTITHLARCEDCDAPLEAFLEETAGLGAKLGPLLFQLPPKFAFTEAAERFFVRLRETFAGEIVCEPRHAEWFASRPDKLLKRLKIARVAADPAPVPEAATPGGWMGIAYYRLHGSPRMYYSAYESDYLARLAAATDKHRQAWVIFDNTARGAAVENALVLKTLL